MTAFKNFLATQSVRPPSPTPPKPTLLQRAGNFAAGVGKAIASPFARVGVEGYNLGAAGVKTAQGNIPGAQAELGKSRNLPILGQTKPTLTNPQKPGVNDLLDVAGQGVQLGADAIGGEGFGSGVMNGIKTGATIGATQGFGNALTQTEGKSVGQNLGNIAGQTAIGGVTGGVIGGATNAIHPIFSRSTPIMDPATVTGAQEQFNAANQNFAKTDVGAAKATNTANQAVQADVGKGGALGQEYAAKLENIPGESNLSNAQLESLQKLKEGKNYQTPDFVEKAGGSQATVGGKSLNPENPQVKAQLEKLTGQAADQTGLKVTSKQAGEIMKGLNETTYKVADGQKVIDQSRIGITKELEQQFAKDFGPDWVKAHSEFKAGVKFRDTFEGIINFDKNAPALDLIKQTDDLQKALQTPGGEFQIQKVIDEYAQVRGEDKASALEDLITKTKEVNTQQEILKTAKTNLAEAVKMAEKGGFSKQFITALKDPRLLARRAVYVAASIPVGIVLLPYLRNLYKSLTK